MAYDYPGNVRELENALERALALAGDESIGVEDLRLTPHVAGSISRGGATDAEQHGTPADGRPLQEFLDAAERDAITAALRETGHNRTAAARLLGVTFRSLRYRLQRLGIE